LLLLIFRNYPHLSLIHLINHLKSFLIHNPFYVLLTNSLTSIIIINYVYLPPL
jgi:hypothetical protein